MPFHRSSLAKSLLSITLSAALIALSPGFAAYEAVAAQVAAPVRASGQNSVAPIVSLGSLPMGSPMSASLTPSMDLKLTGSLTVGAAPSVKTTVLGQAAMPALQISVIGAPAKAQVLPALERSAAGTVSLTPAASAPVSRKIFGLSQQVGAELEAAGDISGAGAEAASGVGMRLESILTETPAASSAEGEFSPVADPMADLAVGSQLARPAGQEISEAAQSYYGKGETTVVRSIPDMPDQNPGPRKTQPLLPRLMASGLALLPAALLGWPLLAGGSLVAGGAMVLASVLLAVLPFMGERTPVAARMAPGVALLGLGALALASGSIWMGALVTLGGWGLMRYGRSPKDGQDFESEKTLTAFFGALGATAGAGLALLSPAGWIATGLIALAYPVAALLLMHLPSWVGHGMVAAFSGVFENIRGLDRVESSLRRDTGIYERLKAYTSGQLKQSLWNAVWLAGIWVPVWLSQLVQWGLAASGGVVIGAMHAPIMFLWGAAHELKADSKPAKFFAAWAHFMFDNAAGAKKSLFNRIQAPLLAYAASRNKLVSLPAVAGIRGLQWLWLAYAVAGTPVLAAVGFFRAFGKVNEPYADASHDPSSLKVDRDDRPGNGPAPEEPEQPGQPSKGSLFPRLLASGIALVPAYFLGLPLLASAGPVIAGVYLAAALGLAALPFMPANTPKLIRQAPGWVMAAMGLGMFYFLPVLPFGLAGFMALAKTNAFWMSALSAAGGWGLARYLGKAATEGGSRYSVDDPEYIGAFFGAAAAVAGLGVVLTGMAGLLPSVVSGLAYLTSPLLLMHLPKSVFTGLGAVFYRLWSSVRNSYDLFGFWERDTKFTDNLKAQSRYWLDKSVWNGSWLSAIWTPLWLSQLAEFVLAGAVGLAVGVVRAPLNFLWGLSYELSPKSPATRFFSGMARTWESMVEGESSKGFFRIYSRGLLKAMDEKSASPSGRPTLKASTAFLLFRLGQALYLLKLALLLPVGLVVGLGTGAYNAFKGSGEDRGDDPFRYREPRPAPPESAPPAAS